MFKAGGMFETPDVVQSRGASNWLEVLCRPADFTPDARYDPDRTNGAGGQVAADAIEALGEADKAALELAYEQGRADGESAARAAAELELAARERLGAHLETFDQVLQQALADRLHETVAALCAKTLGPLVCDEARLQERCETAAAQLGERIAGLKLHLNPDDIALLDDKFTRAWTIIADHGAQRGSLRIEGSERGISDGPDIWRSQIDAALGS